MSNVCILCEKSVDKYSIPEMSLHAFPSLPKRRQIWLKQCKLAHKEVLPNSKICSFHFEPRCFKSGVKKHVLYPDAVPTIFGNDHVKTTNLPLKIAEGKPKNVNKDRMAIQNRQSPNISPTKAASKEIAHKNREFYDIPFTRSAKKVLAGKNSQSRDISPVKTAKKLIAHKNSQSRDTLLPKSLKEGNSIQSRNISLVKTVEKGISVQNNQSRVTTLTKTLEKEDSIQHHDISMVPIVEKVNSSQNSDNPVTIDIQKAISLQNQESDNSLERAPFEVELLQLTSSIFEKKKNIIAELKKEKASLISQLKVSENIIISLNKTAK